MSAVFVVFHLVILLCCLTRDGFAKFVNEGCWIVKMLIICGMFFGTLFIPNSFFVYYAEFTNYGGFVFLVVQSVSLIDFCYIWAEYWALKYNNGNSCYGVLLIVFAFLLYAGTGLLLWAQYSVFMISSCPGSIVWLCVNAILPIAWTIMIILKFHPTGSIITSGGVSILITYLGNLFHIKFSKKVGQL